MPSDPIPCRSRTYEHEWYILSCLNISVEVFFLYAYLEMRFVDDNKSATKNDHEQLTTNFHYIKF